MVRFKSRYLLCEVCVENRSSLLLLEEKAIYHAVKAAVARAHGDYGAALLVLSHAVKYVNAHTGIVLIRCRKSHYRVVWSALPFISFLENRGQKVQCFLNCLHVGAERDEVRRAVLSCSLGKEKDVEEEEMEDDWEDE
ncbi:ribonuclease P/MRP protein subunit POP5 [Engraulis encrasicolus]|uniref:ribonuclease P/MRP protein subunit POP5 n=1 Tax=Engraulis encrasicolus TaxID=184585 RepID=UPI002FD5014A